MRKGFWLKVGLGAAMVFALGLTVLSVARAGKAGLQSALASIGGRIPRELADLPFRLNGRELGAVSGLEVRRAEQEVGDVLLKVQLHDPAFAGEIQACDVAALPIRHVKRSRHVRFRCAEPAEITTGELGRLGDVVFEPGGIRRPLYLTERDLERWSQADIRSLDANMVRDAQGGVHATGRFHLEPHHGRPERGTFDLVAGEQGARFVVRDERGREIVKFDAGDHGISIKVEKR